MSPVFEKELRRTSVISTLYLVLKCLLSPPCDTDAMTSRSCSCPDEELVQMLTRWVTDICEFRAGRWEQEGCYTQDARRVGVGNPNACHSTSSCHWTHDKAQANLGKGSQIRELGAMSCVRCPAHSCSERCTATTQFSFNCGKIHLMWNLPFLPF